MKPAAAASAPCAVAIGASAGGLPALTQVLADLPADLAAAVLIVLHMHRQSPSLLPHLLARDVTMTVDAAREGVLLEAGHVYVAVPDLHFGTLERRVHLTDQPLVHYTRPSIDHLFESVATAWGPRAIGVLLTGCGSDGAAGVAAIKRAGGTTIVQDPRDASFAAMPRAALATGCVDRTLRLRVIGDAITRTVAALGPYAAA
ncbi:MAG TPA: chemotaxis protein CheB [Methylomirabilota bacterium]|nr:chemotaxis protein CheB [Methylomirabilota bacterium]